MSINHISIFRLERCVIMTAFQLIECSKKIPKTNRYFKNSSKTCQTFIYISITKRTTLNCLLFQSNLRPLQFDNTMYSFIRKVTQITVNTWINVKIYWFENSVLNNSYFTDFQRICCLNSHSHICNALCITRRMLNVT